MRETKPSIEPVIPLEIMHMKHCSIKGKQKRCQVWSENFEEVSVRPVLLECIFLHVVN